MRKLKRRVQDSNPGRIGRHGRTCTLRGLCVCGAVDEVREAVRSGGRDRIDRDAGGSGRIIIMMTKILFFYFKDAPGRRLRACVGLFPFIHIYIS